MKKSITTEIEKSIEAKSLILDDQELILNIEQACNIIIKAYENSKKTLLAGNGGSAADAQHITAEFVSRFYFDRPGMASIALTTDTSILTAIGNDYGFEKIFARQIEALGKESDVFIAISTSGNSKNIIEALKTARKMGLITVGLTGENGGMMDVLCDLCIKVPSTSTPRIQECHILIGHIICSMVENNLFGHLK